MHTLINFHYFYFVIILTFMFFTVFCCSISIRALSSRIALAYQVHATCTQLLASTDNYTLLKEYKKATNAIQGLFIELPTMSPVARDDLVVDFPKEALSELESQYYTHGNIRSGNNV